MYSSSVISCRDWKRPLVSGNVIVTGPGIEIEDRTRIRRVAILTDHILMIDRRQLALVLEFTNPVHPAPTPQQQPTALPQQQSAPGQAKPGVAGQPQKPAGNPK